MIKKVVEWELRVTRAVCGYIEHSRKVGTLRCCTVTLFQAANNLFIISSYLHQLWDTHDQQGMLNIALNCQCYKIHLHKLLHLTWNKISCGCHHCSSYYHCVCNLHHLTKFLYCNQTLTVYYWPLSIRSITYSGLGHLKPAGHAVQLSFPPSPNVVLPSEHRTGLCFGDGHMYPIGQSVQFACPLTEKLPAVQSVIAELGVGQL